MVDPTASPCDKLVEPDSQLATYCQCAHQDRVDKIGELTCGPRRGLDQLASDLRLHTDLSTFKLDYLGVSANLSLSESARRPQESLSASPLAQLNIDHLSLQVTEQDDGQSSTHLSARAALFKHQIQRQMIDFASLINETHLQFLSIFIQRARRSPLQYTAYPQARELEQQEESQEESESLEINLAPLLARFIALDRVEVSLDGPVALRLAGDTFAAASVNRKQQRPLRWLKIQGSSWWPRISRPGESPFRPLARLEHLDLELNELQAFPFVSLFDAPLRQAGAQSVGHPSLSSLSLAKNKLRSLASDLFAGMDPFCKLQSANFCLPSLIQLDLSNNRLEGLALREAQWIVCSMPNLNQLYLQHNRIVHLNLNTLIMGPYDLFSLPATIEANTTNSGGPYSITWSKLEHLDVSHNRLLMLTAFQERPNRFGAQAGRLKSLNLAANRLQRPLVVINPQLVGRILFNESFDLATRPGNDRLFSLSYLEATFELSTAGLARTICDAMLPTLNTEDNLIEELIVSENDLYRIQARDFASHQCRNMQILSLSSNRIVLIEHNAFSSLVKLEQLDLSDNLLDQLDVTTFAKTTKLRSLNLSKNKLKRLDQDLFANNIELHELLIDSNELESLSSNLFSNSKQLSILDLSNNRIVQLEAGTFSRLKQLRLLKLQGNLVRKFAHYLFAPDNNNQEVSDSRSGVMPNVIRVPNNVVQQRGHQIHKVPSKFNGSLIIGRLDTQLATPASKRRRHRQTPSAGYGQEASSNALVLAYNQLELFQFASHCDQFSSGIRVLLLNGNFLSDLDSDTFKCLPLLVRLHLQANRLVSIDDLTFRHMTHLEYLDLSSNRLSQVGPKLLLHINALNHLDLSRNQLDGTQLSSLDQLAYLEYLNLCENKDYRSSLASFSRISSKCPIQYLNFGGIKAIHHNDSENLTTISEKVYIDFLNLSSIGLVDELLFTLLQTPMIDIYKLDFSTTYSNVESSSKRRTFILNKLQNSELLELKLSNSQLKDEQVWSLLQELSHPIKLVRLDLDSNQLESWPFSAKTAEKMLALRSINLASNRMRYLIAGKELISYELESLESLNVSSNFLVGIFDESALESKHLHGRSLSAFMPKLKRVDLSQNRISWLPEDLLRGLLDLELLKLNHNQLQALPHLPASLRLSVDLGHNYQLLSTRLDYLSPVGSRYLDSLDDVIITDDSSSWAPQIRCYSVDSRAFGWQVNSSQTVDRVFVDDDLVRDLSTPFAFGSNQYEDQRAASDELCTALLDQVDSIRLDSFSSRDELEIGLIGLSSQARRISISLRNSGLTSLNISTKNANIISLNLERNKVHTLSESVCANLVQLGSLDLSRNQLIEFKAHTFALCEHLRYLDLSLNRIKIWAKLDGFVGLEELVALKLNHNLLAALPDMSGQVFRSLRHLDLRSNKLTELVLLPNIRKLVGVSVVSDIAPETMLEKDSVKLAPSLTKDSLVLNQLEGSRQYGNMTIKVSHDSQEEHTLVLPSTRLAVIKFCMLNQNDKAKVCIEWLQARKDLEGRCFYMQAPRNISTCMTELPNQTPEHGDLSESNSSSLLSSMSHKEQKSDSERDVVLSIIEYLRINWLKFKDMNFNEIIMSISNIRSDSTWSTPDGRYKVNTLIALKTAIIGGAVCIIVLLTATFYLLTYLSGQSEKRKLDDQTPDTKLGDDSSDGNKWSSTSESFSSESRTQTKRCLQDSETCSSLITQSKCSSVSNNTTDNNLPTVVDRSKTFCQLNPIQLFNQQCSTPSSSLAPSSVETGETMNAVDSMQSNNSSLQANQVPYSTSVDHYADDTPSSTLRRGSSYQPVATVMRLVKSNSANFGAHNLQHQRGAQGYGGTLGCRGHNYPALKSRLQPVHSLTSGQYNPVSVLYQLDEQSYDADISADSLARRSLDNSSSNYKHDPSTMSLLSINTALSGAHVRPSASQQVSPASTLTLADQPNELCHYHSRQNYEDSSNQEVIIEVDEEQFQYASSLPPPPPTIRSFEVLQATDPMLLVKADVQNYSHK